jgi:hypothetical protein
MVRADNARLTVIGHEFFILDYHGGIEDIQQDFEQRSCPLDHGLTRYERRRIPAAHCCLSSSCELPS